MPPEEVQEQLRSDSQGYLVQFPLQFLEEVALQVNWNEKEALLKPEVFL